MTHDSLNRKQGGYKASISERARRYFEGEALIARSSDHPRHLNPVFPDGAKVVCVGCGGGWEGEAIGTSRFVAVDIDEEARDFRRERNADDVFVLASGENLPFENGEFTFYMARGCIMYMDMPKFFSEASRVLAANGQIWFTCHDIDHEWQHLRRSVGNLVIKDIVYRSYVIVNGFLYHCFGKMFRFPFNTRRIESFQTESGMRKGLAGAGFSDISFPKTKPGLFLVTARRAGAGQT